MEKNIAANNMKVRLLKAAIILLITAAAVFTAIDGKAQIVSQKVKVEVK